jgi:hypothetical protein
LVACGTESLDAQNLRYPDSLVKAISYVEIPMTSKATITSEIRAKVGQGGYASWRIGLTHDLAERKKYWGEAQGKNVSSWKNWTADSLSDAQDVETYFINEKMMKGGTGGDLSSNKTVYVYVF